MRKTNEPPTTAQEADVSSMQAKTGTQCGRAASWAGFMRTTTPDSGDREPPTALPAVGNDPMQDENGVSGAVSARERLARLEAFSAA